MEKLLGKRDHLYTVAARLHRADGTVVATVYLAQLMEEGRLHVTATNRTYELYNTSAGVWDLKDKNNVSVCIARKPRTLRTMVVLDELESETEYTVKRKVKMESRHMGALCCDVYSLGTGTSDEDALRGHKENLIMKLDSKMNQLKCEIEKKEKDEMSDLFLGYIYFIHLILFRRRSVRYGIATGTFPIYTADTFKC